MPTCTFFGHSDCPSGIKAMLRIKILELICENGVNTFLVGDNGRFDYCCRAVLKEIKTIRSDIHYAVILSRLPGKAPLNEDYEDTLFPEDLDVGIPPRYAVDRRNHWLIAHSDYVICYVHRSYGGAAKFVRIAQRKGKTIFNLPKQPSM